ncbi:MAG: leucyl aminopeptidase family protein [Gammaproteobacteria bacterium]|nr:leucyl aminopeptidase family protein [Gammaproteobacteria bacterium]
MQGIALKLRQHAGWPAETDVEKYADWVVILPFEARRGVRFPSADLLYQRRARLGRKEPDTEPFITELPNENGTRVAFASIKPRLGQFELLTLARKLVAVPVRNKAEKFAVAVAGFPARECERIAEAVIAAAYAAAAQMPSFKSKGDDKPRLRAVELFGVRAPHGFGRTAAEAEGNAIARQLSLLPSNMLTPADYLKAIRRIARENHWKLEFHDMKSLAHMKAGAFLAVAQGSPTADAGIVRLRYQPRGGGQRGAAKVALVGKGICFDTGGVNLKTARTMYNMHQDMQGSAVALGTLLALTKLNYRHPAEAWLALAMNHIGPKSYKPNDVIAACDGTTIEVIDTDAEGRMVLADTLALASRGKPGLIIDFATLTGACVHALGRAYSGIFTNREDLVPRLVRNGRTSGERVWPFPMDADYDEALRSDIADVKQCSTESGTDQILAARFLQRFVKNDVPWVHIDLSAARSKNGLAHIPTETTGFGVRYAVSLLLDGLADS